MTDPVAAAASAAARHALANAPSSSWKHATVTDTATSSDVVDVLVDGDPEVTQALNRAGQVMLAGTRVLVAQPAKGGQYILGTADGLPQRRPRVASVTLGPDTPMADNTLTILPVGTLAGDTDVMVDVSGTAVALVAGTFDLDVMAVFEPAAVGHRFVELLVNGTFRVIGPQAAAAPDGQSRVHYRTTEVLAAGDVVEVRARHTQGTTIDGSAERFVAIFDGA